jgi:hypothetical protein
MEIGGLLPHPAGLRRVRGMIKFPAVAKSFFDRFGGCSPLFWAFIVLLLGLNFWFDYQHPLGIMFDVVILVVLAITYRPPHERD